MKTIVLMSEKTRTHGTSRIPFFKKAAQIARDEVKSLATEELISSET
jgi:hypothetical protein